MRAAVEPATKPSGVPGIERVPSNWGIKPLGFVTTMQGGGTPSKENSEFWNGDIPWVSPKDMKSFEISDSIDKITPAAIVASSVKLIPAGATLVVVRGMILAKTFPVGFSTVPVTVNQDMKALTPGKDLNARFLSWQLLARTKEARSLVEEAGHGTKVFRTDLFVKLMLLVPPLQSQRAIVNFLDRKTAAIDALIEKKRKLVQLLAEKRAALINQAVTKGLDPTVPMKDSGIPWIGEIPAHWDVIELRRLLVEIAQGWSPVAEDRQIEDNEWGVLKLSAISKGRFRPKEHKALALDIPGKPDLQVQPGDLLMTRANTPRLVGETCVIEAAAPRLMISDLIYRLRFNSNVAPWFMCFFFLSDPGRAPVTADARGSSQTMVKISQDHIKAWRAALPPPTEQLMIIDTIKPRLDSLDRTETAILRNVSRLQEYRQALITAAVTGQLEIPVNEPEEVMA